MAQGKFDDALALEQRAFAIRDRVLGEHWHTALSLSTLGYIRWVGGDLDEVRALLERAIAIDEEQFQPVKYETGFDAEVLGRIYVELGLLDEAEIRLDQSVHVFRELGLPRAGHRGWLHLARGEVERARGDGEGAKEELARAIAVEEVLWPGGHPRLREVRELYESL